MVLVDTSVWINFLYKGDENLSKLLIEGRVLTHEFIIGELSCGNIKNRNNFLELINELPKVKTCLFEEVTYFIENNNLYGKGIGFIDAHILASAIISNVKLWTADNKLDKIAVDLHVNYLQ
jgi:predicted nucleic acid-binding protein